MILGYVLKRYPVLSQTFVVNEILALERLGWKLRIFSLKEPNDPGFHANLEQVRASVTYLPGPERRTVWQAAARTQRLYPKGFRRALRLTYDAWRHNSRSLRRFLQACSLTNLIQRYPVTHLHAYVATAPTDVAMLTSRITGLPYSFGAHAKDLYTSALPELRRKIKAAEFVVTCTRANQEYLKQLVKARHHHKINLRYHGIDLEKFSPRQEVPLAERPLILSVGRLVEKKGFPYLLQACAILKSNGYAFRCLIIGEGPERDPLEKMVSALNLQDTVAFPGSRSQEELVEIYGSATVFALPCNVLENGDRDGIPNVLLEAMAVGLPVVSSAISGIPELVESGHNGLLVPERNEEALAAALELLLQDDALRRRLGGNGRSTVANNFDTMMNAQQLAGLFREEGSGQSQQPETPHVRAP